MERNARAIRLRSDQSKHNNQQWNRTFSSVVSMFTSQRQSSVRDRHRKSNGIPGWPFREVRVQVTEGTPPPIIRGWNKPPGAQKQAQSARGDHTLDVANIRSTAAEVRRVLRRHSERHTQWECKHEHGARNVQRCCLSRRQSGRGCVDTSDRPTSIRPPAQRYSQRGQRWQELLTVWTRVLDAASPQQSMYRTATVQQRDG